MSCSISTIYYIYTKTYHISYVTAIMSVYIRYYVAIYAWFGMQLYLIHASNSATLKRHNSLQLKFTFMKADTLKFQSSSLYYNLCQVEKADVWI